MEPVTISVVRGELAAGLVKARLESEGIPVFLKYQTCFNLVVGMFNPFSILVPGHFAAEAGEIIGPDYDLIQTVPKKRLYLFAGLMLIINIFGR